MAIKKSLHAVTPENVTTAKGTSIRWLLGPRDDMPNFYMRVLEVAPKGEISLHNHPWEHEVFVLEGNGALTGENGELPLTKEEIVYVPADEKHGFRNTGNEAFRFICVIPKS